MRHMLSVVQRAATMAVVLCAIAGVARTQTPTPAPAAPAAEAWREAPPTSTGIAVGKPIPAFSVVDQSGKPRDFKSIAGPNGAMIVFQRSVDW